MIEIVATCVWVLIGMLGVVFVQGRIPGSDRRLVWYCFWAHIISAFILIWLTYNFFGRGDIEIYYYYGDALADYIRRDPGRWGPEIARLVFQFPADLPIDVYGHEGSSTTSLIGISAFVMLVNGSSEFGTAMVFSLLAFSGQLAMYAAFRDHFPKRYRRRLLVAVLLVPSAVFWTSGVVKEAVTLGGLGWIIYGLHLVIVMKRPLAALPWIAVGGVLVAISKSYVLFPLAMGAGVWWFWQRSLATKGSVGIAAKPLYLVGAVALAMVAMLGLGHLFPQYSLDGLAEETATLQHQGGLVDGGSSYSMGDATETSLLGQLAFAPVAITASLFRPFLVESHNPVALINGLEMTVVLYLWIRILWVRGVRGSWRMLSSSPVLMFCVVFVLLFGLGVGLATTNLGTLSRYRVPMMPMYILILLMLWPRKSGSTEVSSV